MAMAHKNEVKELQALLKNLIDSMKYEIAVGGGNASRHALSLERITNAYVKLMEIEGLYPLEVFFSIIYEVAARDEFVNSRKVGKFIEALTEELDKLKT